MTGCNTQSASLDICPTADEIVPQLIALLPRGRAWGTHDGGPHPGSTSYQFWYSVASVWEWVNQRICALKLEFFCETQTETHDDWMEEYGLPDGCDPFPDLCTKVAAIGGTRCEYYTAITARAGWAVACYDTGSGCGAKAGKAKAGCAQAGRNPRPGTLVFRVDLANSPAYRGSITVRSDPTLPPPRRAQAGRLKAGQHLSCATANIPSMAPLAGRLKAGRRLGCQPDITGLACLIERIAGAHETIIYEVPA